MAKKKLNKKAKTRIFLFFIIFGSIIGSLSYSFFSNVSKIIEIKNEKKIKQIALEICVRGTNSSRANLRGKIKLVF